MKYEYLCNDHLLASWFARARPGDCLLVANLHILRHCCSKSSCPLRNVSLYSPWSSDVGECAMYKMQVNLTFLCPRGHFHKQRGAEIWSHASTSPHKTSANPSTNRNSLPPHIPTSTTQSPHRHAGILHYTPPPSCLLQIAASTRSDSPKSTPSSWST